MSVCLNVYVSVSMCVYVCVIQSCVCEHSVCRKTCCRTKRLESGPGNWGPESSQRRWKRWPYWWQSSSSSSWSTYDQYIIVVIFIRIIDQLSVHVFDIWILGLLAFEFRWGMSRAFSTRNWLLVRNSSKKTILKSRLNPNYFEFGFGVQALGSGW